MNLEFTWHNLSVQEAAEGIRDNTIHFMLYTIIYFDHPHILHALCKNVACFGGSIYDISLY